MASTGELVSWVKQSKSGWARENDIVPIIRSVVNILCKAESARFLIIDPATGRPPILTTTSLNFGPYDGPVGAWRVSNILLKRPASKYNDYNIYNSSYGEFPVINTTDPVEINGNWYYPFPFVKVDDALDGGRVQISFSRNPGDNSTRYYMQAYREPAQITSDRVQLPIPDSYGCHRLYILPACLSLIEAIDHGDYEKGVTYLEGTIKPLMWKALNRGTQGNRGRVTPRPY